MTSARAWPHRYRVRLTLRSREVVEVHVATMLDAAKAVAIATAHHVRGRAADDATSEPYDVEVDELGPVERGDDGTPAIPRGDLVDRWEF